MDLESAFDAIETAIDSGQHLTNKQKDLCIRATLDALAPHERPWFYEVANMLKVPLWQVLWGQWRRCQEYGVAQAPVLDPGWEGEIVKEYGLEERECQTCNKVFKPAVQGQIFCSNFCGVEYERRLRPARSVPLFAEEEPQSDSVDLGTDVVEIPDDDAKPSDLDR